MGGDDGLGTGMGEVMEQGDQAEAGGVRQRGVGFVHEVETRLVHPGAQYLQEALSMAELMEPLSVPAGVVLPEPFSPTSTLRPGGNSRPSHSICSTAGTVAGHLEVSTGAPGSWRTKRTARPSACHPGLPPLPEPGPESCQCLPTTAAKLAAGLGCLSGIHDRGVGRI